MANIKKIIEPVTEKKVKKVKYPEIQKMLESVMVSFTEELGEKKIHHRISKAIKTLTHGLEKKKNTTTTKVKKAVKKAVIKKPKVAIKKAAAKKPAK